MDSVILQQLDRIEQMLKEQNMLKKEVINFNEACQYLEFSESHLYKLTSSSLIPHYKPNGKKIYFNRKELDTWLLRNRTSSRDEIEQKAADYLVKKGRITL